VVHHRCVRLQYQISKFYQVGEGGWVGVLTHPPDIILIFDTKKEFYINDLYTIVRALQLLSFARIVEVPSKLQCLQKICGAQPTGHRIWVLHFTQKLCFFFFFFQTFFAAINI